VIENFFIRFVEDFTRMIEACTRLREKSRDRRDGDSPAAFVTLCVYRAAFISDRINSFAAETGYAI
jgi:hypothetical protein